MHAASLLCLFSQSGRGKYYGMTTDYHYLMAFPFLPLFSGHGTSHTNSFAACARVKLNVMTPGRQNTLMDLFGILVGKTLIPR